MPAYVPLSSYLNSLEVAPLHEETAQFCIPNVVGEVNPICDSELVFILSVEFFGQVYCEFLQFSVLVIFLKVIYYTACGCNPIGTNATENCSISSGTCVCKQGVGGTLCDRCIPSYYNFSTNGCTGTYKINACSYIVSLL